MYPDSFCLNFRPQNRAGDDEKLMMGKLLSHGYGQDWENDRTQWYDKQRQGQSRKNANLHTPQDRVRSEYQETINTPPNNKASRASPKARQPTE